MGRAYRGLLPVFSSCDLIADIQTARLKLDSALQRRLWDLAAVLDRPRREVLKRAIAELDPWHVLSTRAVGPTWISPTAVGQGAELEDDRDLI
jgi:predicted transcriptional regulator